MKKYFIWVPILVFLTPSISFAAPLTQSQAESLIGVVQASPGTPASAFTDLITAFSNITVVQAESLIGVVQASPKASVAPFVNLLVAFTQNSQSGTAAQSLNNSTATTSVNATCTTPSGAVINCQTGQTISGPSQQWQNEISTEHIASQNQPQSQPLTITQPQSSVNNSNANTPQTSNTDSTQANIPWVHIQADGSDGPIYEPYNGPAVTISWQSNNVTACGIGGTNSWSGNWGTSGSKTASFSDATNTVTIQCDTQSLVNNVVTTGKISDSVTIYITGIPESTTQTKGTPPSPVLNISIANQKPPTTITSGAQNAVMSYFLLDATGSNEDVHLYGVPTNASGALTDLSNCQLFNGNTVVSKAINPAPPADGGAIPMLSDYITISKGSKLTLSLDCNVSSSSQNGDSFTWGFASNDSALITGAKTGASASATITYGNAATITVSN